MTRTITSLAYEAGLSPFDAVNILHGKPEVLGESISEMLQGKNRYFDKEYRERWGVQVHRIETSPNRLVMGAVESALPKGKKTRRYRAVVFRCDGNVLYQTPDQRALDYRSACIDMRYWVFHIDESKALSAMCQAHLRQTEKEHSKAQAVLNALSQGQSP